jgi:hypothetical protein
MYNQINYVCLKRRSMVLERIKMLGNFKLVRCKIRKTKFGREAEKFFFWKFKHWSTS